MTAPKKPVSKSGSDISKSCVIFRLNITLYTGQKTVAKLADEIAKKHKGEAEAMRAQCAAMDRQDRLSVQRIALQARQYLRDRSLTWDDNGARLVKATEYQKIHDELVAYKDVFDKAVRALGRKYDDLVDQAKRRVGDLFADVEFPSSSRDLIDKYAYEFTVDKLSDEDEDIRVAGLSKDAAEQIKAQITAEHTQRTEQVKRELVARIEKVVRNMATSLKNPDKIYRDSLIKNVRELADIAPSLNVTRSPEVDKAIAAMSDLSKDEPDKLREDTKERKKKATEAATLADSLKEFCM